MNINQRQYQQLTEMGISLWQHKSAVFQTDITSKNDSEDKINYLKQDSKSVEQLAKQTFFTDLLLILDLSIGEVTANTDHLDLGLFNWFFYTEDNKAASISCADNKLVTPSIESIRKSPSLKKELWQTITTHLL